MLEFLNLPEIQGIAIGFLTFVIIGTFHLIVIKAEYYFSHKIWWVFLLAGIVSLVFAYLAKTTLLSAILAIVGFSCFWSIIEIRQQAERVRKGWFPRNPKRKYDFDEDK